MHYIDYEALKKLITEEPAMDLEQRLSYTTVQSQKRSQSGNSEKLVIFMKRLESEVNKVNAWATDRANAIQAELDMLKKHLHSSSLDTIALTAQADTIGRELCKLDKFIVQNTTGFRKICKKFDKTCQQTSLTWLSAKLATESFSTMRLDAYVTQLSGAYNTLKLGTGGKEEGKWKPPANFERQTTKYWVRNENLMEVMTQMVKHVPILVMDKKAEGEKASFAPISSVYLDSSDMKCYENRLARNEGAQLFRFRWYGLDPSKMPCIFVERKTHHESWSGDKSVKERYPVQYEQVSDLLKGNANVESRQPTNDILAAEVETAIREQKLQPSIRSVYWRCAFVKVN